MKPLGSRKLVEGDVKRMGTERQAERGGETERAEEGGEKREQREHKVEKKEECEDKVGEREESEERQETENILRGEGFK